MDQQYDSQEVCRWFFWSGKLGWERLQKSSWAKLDEMWFENNRSGEPSSEVSDVGGWRYEYTIDVRWTLETMKNCPLEYREAEKVVGYQTALHENSRRKVRWVAYV